MGDNVKKIISALLCAMAVFFIISCKSTPKEEPQTETQDVVTDVKEEVAQTVDYSAANQSLWALTEVARQDAIASGAKKYYAEGFEATESIYSTVKNDLESSPSVDHSEKIKDLTSRYKSLSAASQARVLKEKADTLSLSGEDKASYEAGEKALAEYLALGTSASGDALLAKANEALNAYNDVVNKGLKANAARERQASLEAKRKADSVKAGVAKKDEYLKAAETFKKADSSYVTGDIEGAFKGYRSSKEVFVSLFETIQEKRMAAQALIDAAKQRVSNAENYAVEADSIAPLSGEVAGIEKEDAVLLEEDKFENPEKAVIDVEGGVTAKTAEKVAETAISAEEKADSVKNNAATQIKDATSEAK